MIRRSMYSANITTFTKSILTLRVSVNVSLSNISHGSLALVCFFKKDFMMFTVLLLFLRDTIFQIRNLLTLYGSKRNVLL